MKNIELARCRRVLVTGSRGKSTVVRLVHTGLTAVGLHTYSRITGVVPRQIGPDSVCGILRSAGAHVEEMRWWLGQLPQKTEAIVLENSAVSVELQGMAARWLNPEVVILTNTVPDHQEIWGPSSFHAANALLAGIPDKSSVVLSSSDENSSYLVDMLHKRRCTTCIVDTRAIVSHHEYNKLLALAAIRTMALDVDVARCAMEQLEADICDFRIIDANGVELAFAFTVNDIESTQKLYASTGWKAEETVLLFNHRADRDARLESFFGWITEEHWKDVVVIGDKPPHSLPVCSRYVHVKSGEELISLFEHGERVFGCGNVAGVPLTLMSVIDRMQKADKGVLF